MFLVLKRERTKLSIQPASSCPEESTLVVLELREDVQGKHGFHGGLQSLELYYFIMQRPYAVENCFFDSPVFLAWLLVIGY